MFTVQKPFPGVYHITDAMGVSFTLLEGRDRALLVDAGYGTEDVGAYVKTLTDRPCELVLTHGHHDHVLGARYFSHCLMDAADQEEFLLRTGRRQREAVAAQAREKQLSLPEDFLTAPIPLPQPITWPEEMNGLGLCRLELGDREVLLLRVPGHTAGSVVCYLPGERLLLTGDDWNPCTWMWFPCSLPVKTWREHMLQLWDGLEAATGASPLHVLCSHQPLLRGADELKAFLSFMTDERLGAAPPVDMGNPAIATREVACAERGWTLIFDAEKKAI